jgi:hypothetical protein
MQSDTISVQKLFQDRRQYLVPFFQRAYVWNREDQWERLWADISERADIRAGGEQPPPHFLGATVLEPQQRKGLIGVETLHIIDGQQRLTTLQYFLSALAIVLREEQQSPLLSLVEGCLWNVNKDTMQQPDVEIFKVWPTFRDRPGYKLAMSAIGRDDLREKFPYSFTQNASLRKIGVDHPPALEAIWYFAEQITQWIAQEGESQTSARLNAVTEAIFQDLHLVSISLGEQDDAQVIFETLNGHGAQLHATDLIRNFVFMRADREGVAGAELFDSLWSQFEGGFWAEAQRRGRLQRPRLEWFIQTALQAASGDEIEIGRLYAGYRRFAAGGSNPLPAETQLRFFDGHGRIYRQLVSGSGDQPIARFGYRTLSWDASTTHPLALRIADIGLPADGQEQMFDDITSYLVRRAICGLTSKNYNKIFLSQLKKLSAQGLTPDSLRASLSELDGDASRWPSDEEFRRAWISGKVYPGRIDAPRCKSLLAEIEAALRSKRSEEPLPGGLENLDIDHILPTSWFEYWPLADGTQAQPSEAADVNLLMLIGNQPSERLQAIFQREEAKATIGNLTLVHYGVNRSLQNREFVLKRERFFEESNLHLNRQLMKLASWSEADISARGTTLFDLAVKLWRGPT